MPLTEKGREILRAMQRTYGAKRGERVLYASKNKGTITGVDAASYEETGAGAESWVHGRQNSTGYRITGGDRVSVVARVRDAGRRGLTATDALAAAVRPILAARTADARSAGLAAVRDAARRGLAARDAISQFTTGSEERITESPDNRRLDMTQDAFEEGKHPRGEGGKFTHEGHSEVTRRGYVHTRSESDPRGGRYGGTYHHYEHPRSGSKMMIKTRADNDSKMEFATHQKRREKEPTFVNHAKDLGGLTERG